MTVSFAPAALLSKVSWPVPREHGAWFMLYLPLITVLFGLQASFGFALLLCLTVTGGFLGQNTVVLLLRGRADQGAVLGGLIYGFVFVTGSVLLLGVYHLIDLVYIGAPAALALLWLFIRSRLSRKRIDRTFSGEMLAIAGLTLTAPAAVVVAHGHLTQTAIGLWGVYVLFFASSVLYVKMRILAVQKKSGITFRDRLNLGSGLMLYHVILFGNLFTFYVTESLIGQYLLIGFAPIFVRAGIGWVTFSNVLPNLKRLGLIESVYTLWFSYWLITILHTF